MKRFLPLVLLVIFCAVLTFLVLATRATHLTLGDAIQINQRGQAYQEKQRIGITYLQGDTQEMQLLLVSPKTTDMAVATQFEVNFPQPASSVVRPRFVSIQGTDSMLADWLDEKTLIVTIIGVVPDSYTKLILEAPKGYFAVPATIQFFSVLLNLPLIAWAAIAALIVATGLLFGYIRIFQGRWPKVADQLPQPPESLEPLDMAVLHHGAITPMDVVGFLYDLAGRHYLQVIEQEDEVSFLRTGREDGLNPSERNFLLILFPAAHSHARLSEILATLDKELFSAVVSQLYVDLYERFSKNNYFDENPRHIHIRYKTNAIIMQFAGLLVTLLAYIFFSKDFPGLMLVGAGLYVAGSVFYGLGYQFRPFSARGRAVVRDCARFYAYLVDRRPIGVEGQTGYLFYKYLPFATTLGCIEQWQQRFTGVRMYVPDWYFSQMHTYVLADTFVEETAKHADLLANAMSSVKDPNVD